MKLKVIIREAEEGGYWAEIPAIPGCATQGETFEEVDTGTKDQGTQQGGGGIEITGSGVGVFL